MARKKSRCDRSRSRTCVNKRRVGARGPHAAIVKSAGASTSSPNVVGILLRLRRLVYTSKRHIQWYRAECSDRQALKKLNVGVAAHGYTEGWRGIHVPHAVSVVEYQMIDVEVVLDCVDVRVGCDPGRLASFPSSPRFSASDTGLVVGRGRRCAAPSIEPNAEPIRLRHKIRKGILLVG